MTIATLKVFGSQLVNPSKKIQVASEISFVGLLWAVSYIGKMVINKPWHSPTACLVTGFSSLVLNHVVDAIAMTLFPEKYNRRSFIGQGIIGATTSIANTTALYCLSKIMSHSVSSEDYVRLPMMYGIIYNISFKKL